VAIVAVVASVAVVGTDGDVDFGSVVVVAQNR
jgi:hypothetical protein